MISLHTSPLEQPGAGDAGGMNVYISHLARALAADGLGVDIFTRATDPSQPDAIAISPGVTVHHIPAGPARKLAKEQMPPLADEFAEGILRRTRGSAPPRAVHSHYWVSGLAGLRAATEWDVPLVHTMHTMARVKNRHLAAGDVPSPRGASAASSASRTPRPDSRPTRPPSGTSSCGTMAWTRTGSTS